MATARQVRYAPTGPFAGDGSIDPADIQPGPLNTALRTVDNGDGPIAAWMPDTGGGGLFLVDFLERAGGNVADAIALALTENPTARALYLPAGELALTRAVIEADGLRSNLAFIGVPGQTRITRSAPATFNPCFSFPTGASDVYWFGVGFETNNPTSFYISILCYQAVRWNIDRCSFVGTTPFTGGTVLRAGGPAMLGSTNCRVTNCYFERTQCGFGGLGESIDGALFENNIGVNVNDFLVSAVGGVTADRHIRNVQIVNNQVYGILGTGVVFVGADGESNMIELVEDVLIQGNTFYGDPEEPPSSLRNIIVIIAGVETRNITIVDNTFAYQDETHAVPSRGVLFGQSSFTTSVESVDISDNTFSQLGTGAAEAIYISAELNRSSICDNIVAGCRGILVANPVDCTIARNTIDGTGQALFIFATSRNVERTRVLDNAIFTEPLFQNAIALQSDAAFSIEIDISRNQLSSLLGNALAFTPNATGIAQINFIDNELIAGTLNAAAIDALIFARDNAGFP